MARQKVLLSRIETELAEPTLYDGPAEPISDLNRQRSDAQYALIGAESDWLDAAEALEQAEAEAQTPD